MIKKINSILIILFLPYFFYSQSLQGTYHSEDTTFTFEHYNYIFSSINLSTGEQTIKSGSFIEKKDAYDNDIIELQNFDNNIHEFRFFVFDDFLIMYSEIKNRPFFLGSSYSSRRLESIISTNISSTSYLQETNKKYVSDKLSNYGILDYVWSEGVQGSGIGERLFIMNQDFKVLYLLPGYVSTNRPDLYKKNNRPKTIKIIYDDYEEIKEIPDLPIFYKIDIKQLSSNTIIIEIVDVYHGTKYDDTCITSILCCNEIM